MNETHILMRHSTGSQIALVKKASNWWSKGIGLLGQRALPDGHGMWLPGIGAVHTLFMNFPVDLVFLDRNLQVIKIELNVAPGCFNVSCKGASHTIELGAGTLNEQSLRLHDVCDFEAI